MRLILFLCQWQILIQTMNLLCIYDVHYPPYLFRVSHQGGEQVDDIEAEHRGYQGGKVKATHLQSPAFLLHPTVPVFCMMIHDHHIGCQDMEIWIAPSVMLNIGRREEAESNH